MNPILIFDILPNIIKFLPLNEACRLRVVCHAWRDCIDDYFRSVKVLYLRGREQNNTDASLTFRHVILMRRSMGLDNIRTIHFNQILLRPTFSPNQQFAVILAMLFPNATELYFLDWNYWRDNKEPFTELCQELFSSLTGIKKLAIDAVWSDKIMDSIVENLESLNTLIYFSPLLFPSRVKPFLERLEKFCFSRCGMVIPALGSSTNLKAISFRITSSIDENTMNLLSEANFPNLRHIGLCLSHNFSYIDALRQLLSVNPRISSLELYTDTDDCDDFSDTSHPERLFDLLSHFPALKSLTISVSFRCRPLLEWFARKIHNFRSLEILCLQTRSSNINHRYFLETETILEKFFRNLPIDRSPIIAGSRPKIVIEHIEFSPNFLLTEKLNRAGYAFPVEVKTMRLCLNV